MLCEEIAAISGDGFYKPKLAWADRDIADVLVEHRRATTRDGTPNGIRMDRGSGLIWSPATSPGWTPTIPAATPREGYP